LLLLFIPLCAGLAVYGHVHRQRWRAIHAHQAISGKGVDAHFQRGLDHVIYFKHANVTDDDLEAFIPAFNGYAPAGFGRITGLRLNGSHVSADAVRRFRRAVPDCEVYY
jgi:hypothetical protein